MNLDRNEDPQNFKFAYFSFTFEYLVQHALGLILALPCAERCHQISMLKVR